MRQLEDPIKTKQEKKKQWLGQINKLNAKKVRIIIFDLSC